jgi:hypothetical protein
MVHGVADPVTVLEGVKVRVPEVSKVVAGANVTLALPETSPGSVSAEVAKVNAVPVAVPLAGLVKPPRRNVPSVVAPRSHAPFTPWNSTGLSASVIVIELPVVTSVPRQLTKVPTPPSNVGTNVVVAGTTIGDGNVTVMVDPTTNSLVVVKSIVQALGALSVVVIGTNVTLVLWARGWTGELWPAPWRAELAFPTAPIDGAARANVESTASDETRLTIHSSRDLQETLNR